MSLFAIKPLSRIKAESEGGAHTLKRTLGPGSLIALGIGAIIGAGLFSLTGIAAAENAGPAIALSFVLAAIGCAFAGLCYSEFATMIPIAGSAYTYAYATMGEFLAWIIGWDLVLEYAVGAATVSISWSAYVTSVLHDFGISLPPYLIASPWQPVQLPNGQLVHGLVNLPAVFIICVVSLLLMTGIKESASVNGVVVVIKVAVVLVFIGVGVWFVKGANYTPFIPQNTGTFGEFGWSGILRAAGVIFFAYIGFDAVSTAAQEAKNPQKDMPVGIIGSLIICTILYVAFALVMTGLANYKEFKGVAAPVAVAIAYTPFKWLQPLVKMAIIAGFTSVILVMLLGQSRVFFSMSRDGLLPRIFSDIHPKFRTPWRSNLLFMVFVSLFSAFAPISMVGHMTSIGTLFAFIIVCAGILIMRRTQPDLPRPFRAPWVPVVPILGILVNFAMMYGLGWQNWTRLLVWLVIGLCIYFGYSRSHSRLRTGAPARANQMGLYAVTVVLSAFLLFLVQPIAGRILLPQFGGSAGVWAACLLFFQLVLLAGYLYGHWLATKLAPRMQALAHISLVAASLALLPLALGWGHGPGDAGDPTVRILGLLATMVGLPFLMLSASTPLLQSWYARGHGSQLPYRLFAFSNAGSLAGLLCYPVMVEPYLSLRSQTYVWAAAYGVFALLSCTLAALSSRNSPGAASAATAEPGPRPRRRDKLLWVVLAACSSSLLLAVTNLMTRDVAPVPLLWILPLSLYLASYILCFAPGPWRWSGLFGWLVTPALFALALVLVYSGVGRNLALAVAMLSAGFFVCCMFCHGELARWKPQPRHLTQFYLMIALGGALGGLYVALIAPRTYNENYELPVMLALCAFLAWRLTPRSTATTIRLVLTLALIAYACDVVYTPLKQARVAQRNFYGTVKVIDSGEGAAALRTLLHGTVRHGSQWLSPERRGQATAYYGPRSGGALAIQHLTAGSRRVGLVGLGCGTLAAYGRAGDYYRFYELNPLVTEIARTQFSYLKDCPSKVDIVEGDARLSLAREPAQQFDVLVLDAFSGDSVPVHLLSREAFQLYFRHLKPEGVLAVHVSNRFVDLTSVVARGALSLGRSYLAVLSLGVPGEQTLAASWVLVSANRGFLASPVFKADGRRIEPASRIRLWTDDYSNLFQALR